MTLINGLEELKIDYDNKKLNQTETFYEMLIEKNKVMNLTRITDREDYRNRRRLSRNTNKDFFPGH